MLRRTVLLVLVAALAGPAAARPEAGPAELVALMREGGHVLFLRHAATDESQIDTGRLGDRAGQRNLSAEGRAQARALGEAFRRLAIPLEAIKTSPVFRSRDTAELMFGEDAVEVSMDIVADDYAGAHLGAMLEATERLLATPPEEGANMLLVGHRTPLEMVTGRRFPDSVLPEGALAVFTPEGGEAVYRGTIHADALIGAE